jgi:23S rRNA pseudouridine2605 synthase
MKKHPEESLERNIGLARVLSKLGYCSRAQAIALIQAGKVRVNGALRRDAELPIHMSKDKIEVDGELVKASKKIYLMLNKPRGIVTTTSDEKGRETVYSLLSENQPWLSPVGRLDKASEGLLMMTNDSEWAARITNPETHLAKTYHVQIDGILTEGTFKKMRVGIRTDQNDVLRVKSVNELRRGERNAWLEIVLEEGKNRHIRRMLETLDIRVLRLVRVKIGPLELGTLVKGMFREITDTEKRRIDKAIGV